MRVVVWDKRGTGLSDPATHVPPLDERMDDLHAVLDAAEVDRPALFGMSEGGPMSLLFAATYPERVQSLVMYGAMAGSLRSCPIIHGDLPPKRRPLIWKRSKVIGVKGRWLSVLRRDCRYPGFRDLYGRYQRTSASPTMAAWLWQALLEIDVRGILGSIRAPTLVLARHGDRMAPLEGAPALAPAFRSPSSKHCPQGRTGSSMTRWVRPSSTS